MVGVLQPDRSLPVAHMKDLRCITRGHENVSELGDDERAVHSRAVEFHNFRDGHRKITRRRVVRLFRRVHERNVELFLRDGPVGGRPELRGVVWPHAETIRMFGFFSEVSVEYRWPWERLETRTDHVAQCGRVLKNRPLCVFRTAEFSLSLD